MHEPTVRAADLPEVRVTTDEVSIRWPDREGVTVVPRDDRIDRDALDHPPFSIALAADKADAR